MQQIEIDGALESWVRREMERQGKPAKVVLAELFDAATAAVEFAEGDEPERVGHA